MLQCGSARYAVQYDEEAQRLQYMKHDKMTRMQNQVAECGRLRKTAELWTRMRTMMMTKL
jgi:hypothetical protein